MVVMDINSYKRFDNGINLYKSIKNGGLDGGMSAI
jgi:hypothetical protein